MFAFYALPKFVRYHSMFLKFYLSLEVELYPTLITVHNSTNWNLQKMLFRNIMLDIKNVVRDREFVKFSQAPGWLGELTVAHGCLATAC